MALLGKDVHLNFEDDVIFYEVERDESVNLDDLPQEVQDEIEAKNTKFLTEVVEPEIMKTFGICQCNMPEFIARNERKRQLLAVPPQAFQPTIEQEDVDKYKYAIIVISDHGVMTGVSCFMRECKTCHKIDYWGDVSVFAHLLAEITTNFVTMNQETESEEVSEVDVDADHPLGPGAMLSDIPEPPRADKLETTDIGECGCGENCTACCGETPWGSDGEAAAAENNPEE